MVGNCVIFNIIVYYNNDTLSDNLICGHSS